MNKTYLQPIKASDYFNSVSSCHVLTCPPPFNKNSTNSKLKHPSRNIFSITPPTCWNLLSPQPTVLKFFNFS